MADFTLHDLEKRVRMRAQAPADASYTRKLLNQGVAECAKKLGEEAIETVIAAVGKDRGRLIAETADLIYHLLVVLAARGITLAEVEAELAARTRQSGLQEKASRKGGSGPAPAARKIKTRLRQPKAREQGDGPAHRRQCFALPHLLAGRMGGEAPRHADDIDLRRGDAAAVAA